MEKLSKILKLIESLIERIPTKDSKENIVLYSYLLSLFDISSDILFLVKNNRFKNIPVITRSFLETYIDLLLLSKSNEYIYTLMKKADEEEINKINGFLEFNEIEENEKINLTKQKEKLKVEIKECINYCNTLNPQKIKLQYFSSLS